MNPKTIVVSLFALFLLAGCAKFRFDVPDGFKIIEEQRDNFGQGKWQLTNEAGNSMIFVNLMSAEVWPLDKQVDEYLSLIADLDGVITEKVITDYRSSARLEFTYVAQQSHRTGRVFFRQLTERNMTIVVFGWWLDSQAATAGPAFEAVAASADYK
ncbi:MAG: hypothetical protein WCT10_03015 [Patescibacteria group bacterium]|jgi:hypothetical protein